MHKKPHVLHVNKEDAELRTTELSVSTDKVHIAAVSGSKRIDNGNPCSLNFLQQVVVLSTGFADTFRRKNAIHGRPILNSRKYHMLPNPLEKKKKGKKKNMPLGFCN